MLPVSPITEDTLMIRPVPRSSMCSSACCAMKNAPDRLTVITFSQSSSVILATVRSMAIPALLTRMSSRPRWSRSEEHTSELQSRENLVCRLLLEKKKKKDKRSKIIKKNKKKKKQKVKNEKK